MCVYRDTVCPWDSIVDCVTMKTRTSKHASDTGTSHTVHAVLLKCLSGDVSGVLLFIKQTLRKVSKTVCMLVTSVTVPADKNSA